MPGYTLYVWGGLPFEVYPFNVERLQHVTETDWARKEIVDAAIHHEWVGENEEELHFEGRCFPHFFKNHARYHGSSGWGGWTDRHGHPHGGHIGEPEDSTGGLGHLEIMDNRRRLGQVHQLTRGDGWYMGWFGIKRLLRGHQHFGPDGIGQMIQFEVYFTRFPVPWDPGAYFVKYWGSQP